MPRLHREVLRSLTLLLMPVIASAQASTDLGLWQGVATTLRSPAAAMAGYVRFSLPRVDFTLAMRGVTLDPAMAQGGWVGFAGSPASALLMGDLVVRTDELPVVLAALDRQGFEVSAVHNHLLSEVPTLAYVHIAAQGPAAAWASKLDSVLQRTALPRPVQPLPAAGSIDSSAVFTALGLSGRIRGGLAQASVVLVNDTVRWHDRALPPALILASPINVQSAGNGRFVATGDFVLTKGQVAPLLKVLAQRGILVTATHSHLVGESPTLTFVHFWADGALQTVTGGLKAAIAAARAAGH